ncbi:MAG: glycosyltransferase [archaeon]|jgi:glycosyltransferase involved in cell wall biosynthesis
MGKILVSVVVPTLNEEKFVDRCLVALRNQTVPRDKYEIIVSDSSSSDSTVKIAEALADRVAICKRKSAGFGRNYGAKFAKGKYLGFVDADTIVSRNWVEGLIDGLDGGIACTGPAEALEKDSVRLQLFFKMWDFQTKSTVLINYPLIPGFNIGVRAGAFKKIDGFQEKNITSEDLDLSIRLGKMGKIIFSEKMAVKTSVRRLKEDSPIQYILNGTKFVFFGKSRSWEDHRKDFKLEKE